MRLAFLSELALGAWLGVSSFLALIPCEYDDVSAAHAVGGVCQHTGINSTDVCPEDCIPYGGNPRPWCTTWGDIEEGMPGWERPPIQLGVCGNFLPGCFHLSQAPCRQCGAQGLW
jgi:hypothetical protein